MSFQRRYNLFALGAATVIGFLYSIQALDTDFIMFVHYVLTGPILIFACVYAVCYSLYWQAVRPLLDKCRRKGIQPPHE